MAQNVIVGFDASDLTAGAQQVIRDLTGAKDVVDVLGSAMQQFNARGDRTRATISGLTADGRAWSTSLRDVGGQLQAVSSKISATSDSFSLLKSAANSALSGFNVSALGGLTNSFAADLSAGIDRALELEQTQARIQVITNETIDTVSKGAAVLTSTHAFAVQKLTNELSNNFTELGGKTVTAFANIVAATQKAIDKLKEYGNAALQAAGGTGTGGTLKSFGGAVKDRLDTYADNLNFQRIRGFFAEGSVLNPVRPQGPPPDQVTDKDLANQFGRKTPEVDDAQLAAVQQTTVGKAGDNVKLLTAANELARNQSISLKDAVVELGKTMDAYGLSADKAAQASQTLFVIQKDGAVAPEQIAAAMQKLSPVASQLGVSLEETGAAFITLTQRGYNAEQASRLLELALNRMQKATGPLKTALDQAGIASLKAEVAANGFGGVLNFIAGEAAKGGGVLGEEFGIRSVKAFQTLAESTDAYNKELTKINQSLKELPSLPLQDLTNRTKESINAAQKLAVDANKIKTDNIKGLLETQEAAKLASKSYGDSVSKLIQDFSRQASAAQAEIERASKVIQNSGDVTGSLIQQQKSKFASGGFLNQFGQIQGDQQIPLIEGQIKSLTARMKELFATGTKDSVAEADKVYGEIQKLQTQLFDKQQANQQKQFDERVKQGQVQPVGKDAQGRDVFQRTVNLAPLEKQLNDLQRERNKLLDDYIQKQQQIKDNTEKAAQAEKDGQRELSDLITKVVKAPTTIFDTEGNAKKNFDSVEKQKDALDDLNKTFDRIKEKIGSSSGLTPDVLIQLAKLQQQLTTQLEASITGKTATDTANRLAEDSKRLKGQPDLTLDKVNQGFKDLNESAPQAIQALNEVFADKSGNLAKYVNLLREAQTLVQNLGNQPNGPVNTPTRYPTNDQIDRAQGQMYGGPVRKAKHMNQGGYPSYMDEGGATPVSWQPRGSDQIPTMLAPGEFVVNAQAAQQFAPLLQAINSGGVGARTVNNGGNVVNTGDINLNVSSQQAPQQSTIQLMKEMRRIIQRGLQTLHG